MVPKERMPAATGRRFLPRTSLRSIFPRSAKSSGSVKEEQPAEPQPSHKANPIVAYMEGSSNAFQTQVAQPMKALFAEMRNMRNYIVVSGDLSEKHPKLVEMAQKVDDESWRLLENTKRVDRRLRTQQQKVSKKFAARPVYTTVMKSTARKEAGKLKAASLTMWRQDFSTARDALKQEGYKGSLKLKKGMPMYAKIEELRKSRIATASRSAASTEAI